MLASRHLRWSHVFDIVSTAVKLGTVVKPTTWEQYIAFVHKKWYTVDSVRNGASLYFAMLKELRPLLSDNNATPIGNLEFLQCIAKGVAYVSTITRKYNGNWPSLALAPRYCASCGGSGWIVCKQCSNYYAPHLNEECWTCYSEGGTDCHCRQTSS
jgi:hypothetical protein